MALLKSTEIPLGFPAPDFRLRSVEDKLYTLADFGSAKVLLVLFICNHCPYVQAIEERILALHRDYGERGVQLVGICSNDPQDYPDDSPENLKKRWLEKQYGFPYLIDETQEVARAYGAVCTPDLYVFDTNRALAYHGRLDDSWQDSEKVTQQDLRHALEALLAGRSVVGAQVPSMGCSIKWKKNHG